MNVSDAKRFLDLLVKNQVRVSPLLVGPMGCGKSEIVKQVADENGIALVDLRLAQMEEGDLIGIPYLDKENSTSKWAAPEWFPKKDTRGILFLDEINRATHEVRQAVFQLIWDKRIHRHILPIGWIVVAAMNPDNSDYQVETLDKAMLRRFCILSVDPTVDSWMDWAMTSGEISSDIIGFIGTHKNMLFEPEPFEIPVKRNNAAWSSVNLLKKSRSMPSDLEFEIIAGIVGKEAATAYRKYQDDHYLKPVSGEDVLKDYDAVKERISRQRTKADEMYVTIKEIVKYAENNTKLTKKQRTNLVEFLLDIPADTQAMLIADLPTDLVSILAEEDKRVLVVGRVSKQARADKKDA